MKYLISDDTLKDMADAIREKSGEQDLIQPKDYAGAIRDLSTGEELPDELFNFNSLYYRFPSTNWNWFIEKYGNRITTSNITKSDYGFYYNTSIVNIPFEINCKTDGNCSFNVSLYDCRSLRHMPKININSNITIKSTGIDIYQMFSNNYNLEDVILPVLYNENGNTSSLFPVSKEFYRLSKFVFQKNEDGTPIKAKWKNQTIALHFYIGYTVSNSYITNYSKYTGITTETQIIDSSTYNNYKNHPDRWTSIINYSLYNRLSAIETINSLPDTSEYLATVGGTNTIKFKGNSGSSTDGGAINTMTAEEIAVATSKGWTVTFV